MKKSGSGSFQEKCVVQDHTRLTAIKWFDNKAFHLLMTFSGVYPLGEVKRFDRKLKSEVQVKCPAAVFTYVKFMGGVDLLDSLLAL